MSKQKVELGKDRRDRLPEIFDAVRRMFPEAAADLQDGLKLDFPRSWVHLRPSNTEPIVRIYSEAPTKEEAEALASSIQKSLESLNG
jgi:phosphomannomutase